MSNGDTGLDVRSRAAVLSGVRVIAFLWVLDNVYWISVRYAETGKIPSEVGAAAFLMFAAIWAALTHRRWGWYAMVWMTYVTIADMLIALLVVAAHGVVNGLGIAEIGRRMEAPIGFVGLGTTFGLLNIALWILSAFLLDADRVYVALAQGKRRELASAQTAIATVVVAVYVFALLNMGPTQVALRQLSAAGQVRASMLRVHASPTPFRLSVVHQD